MALKVGILTSTRADFGIYIPLLKELISDSYFEVELIVFGTHLSKQHGFTANEIEKQGFIIKYKLKTTPNNDTPASISKSIGETIVKFSKFWSDNKFDLVFALGDRYEMFAAVAAASLFNIKFAHLHAGETTLGAIDNSYRHSISLMSTYLFVSTDKYKMRAIEINKQPDRVFKVGALSIDNLRNIELYTKNDFLKKFNIDLEIPTILSTFHPETVDFEHNEFYIDEILNSFKVLRNNYQIVITMPNADTNGLMIRNRIEEFSKGKANIFLVESFGMKGYLSCMKHCSLLLGNTSSGFVEAAFFPKWVINLGDRQKGRIITDNIISIPIEKQKIIDTVDYIAKEKLPMKTNIYGSGDATIRIKEVLKLIE